MNNEIILFEDQDIRLEVNMKDETVWLTQKQMAKLFDKNENTINEHINNIFMEGELLRETSTGISVKSSGGRKAKIYNLDVIISVGYRVKSKNGIIFRKWANKVLKDYSIERYTVDIINCSNLITNDEYNLLEKEVLIDLIINFLTN